jgi:hypothetical protein
MGHEILGLRARLRFPAGGRIPTIACGMIGAWRRGVKKRFAGVRVSIRSERLELAERKAFGLSTHARTGAL